MQILALILALSNGPASDAEPASSRTSGFETLTGFSTVLLAHINATLASENLPVGMGVPVEPGVFVTLTRDRAMVFDESIVMLGKQRMVPAPECKSGCSSSFFEAFQRLWLDLAIESQALELQLPGRVLFAADALAPAHVLIDLAYAVAETRMGQPPQMAIVLNAGPAGLRSLPFFLLPPEGLTLRFGDRALALTVTVEAAAFVLRSADPRMSRDIRVANRSELDALLRDVRRQHPGKTSIIIEAGRDATVKDVVGLALHVREEFTTLVLSAGQRVRIQ